MNSHQQPRNTSTKRLFIFTICLIFSAASNLFGQEVDMDCRPITLPVQCHSIRSQIFEIEENYESRINALNAQLLTAVPTQKPAIILATRKVIQQQANDPQLKKLKIDLENCRRQFDTVPRRTIAADVLNTVFDGSVETQTTNPKASGPYFKNITLGLQFSRNRCQITITRFPPVTLVAKTTNGDVKVTVAKVGGGSGNFFPLSGEISIPVNFLFQYDSILAKDDHAATTFTTGNSVSPSRALNVTGARFVSTNHAPVDQCGLKVGNTNVFCSLRIVGTTVFEDGFLGGSEGAFTVRGTIDVPPPQPQQTRSQCLASCEEVFHACMEQEGKGAPTKAQCGTGRTACRNNCPRQ